MTTIKFFHISDLHIAAKKGPLYSFRSAERARDHILKKLSSIIYKNRNQVDAILLTGDIADTGHIDNIKKAARFIFYETNKQRRGDLIKQLKDSCDNIILLPGNHDRYTSFLDPRGEDHFDYIFQNYWGSGFGGIKTAYLPNNTAPVLAVICADFCLDRIAISKENGFIRGAYDYSKKIINEYGCGQVYPERLDNLVKETKKARKITNNVIWSLHFPPEIEYVKDLTVDKRNILIDGNRLVSTAQENDVGHIFCGHFHQDETYFAKSCENEKVKIHCNGTSAVYKKSGDYVTCFFKRKLSIEEGKIIVSNTKYLWKEHKSKFEIVESTS